MAFGRLERTTGPAPMSELARPFRMALPSFSQHLDVLEAANLVRFDGLTAAQQRAFGSVIESVATRLTSPLQ